MKMLLINTKPKILNRAFTLIELLVVISIIGILAALATVSFTASQKQARDINRKSDLSQYRTSLEAFANKNGGLYISYTSRITPDTTANFCQAMGFTTCPGDPKSPDSYYSYISDGTGGGSTSATEYVLYAKLENISVPGYTNWVVCSNGKSGKLDNRNPTSGACPI